MVLSAAKRKAEGIGFLLAWLGFVWGNHQGMRLPNQK
jgi:hypothetical protein